MNKNIDYYFTTASPLANLASLADDFLRSRSDKSLIYKPISITQMIENSIEPAIECRLHSIADHCLPDKIVIALQETRNNVGEFVIKVWSALWLYDKDLNDINELKDILRSMGLDAELVLRYANSKDVQSIYKSNTTEAITRNSLGLTMTDQRIFVR
ncbi:DsbA family protein [Vibrio algarum]|uniref:DsbA family protein n=1 Tax=Vibrio algarum TaxID=3020714 RepID=A0ABT4YN13_9VIBR|nr:DsbA family protein [Vibrio sp. KJ40-1]MDB1122944.1 DsbA family protein [Vibrio sp. KJ40-1]